MNNRLEKVIDAIYPLVCDSESTVEEVAEAAIAVADATRPVTDAMVLAYLNEQQRIVAQDLAFNSLREAVEYLGKGYVDDVRRCLEAALKVTE